MGKESKRKGIGEKKEVEERARKRSGRKEGEVSEKRREEGEERRRG